MQQRVTVNEHFKKNCKCNVQKWTQQQRGQNKHQQMGLEITNVKWHYIICKQPPKATDLKFDTGDYVGNIDLQAKDQSDRPSEGLLAKIGEILLNMFF